MHSPEVIHPLAISNWVASLGSPNTGWVCFCRPTNQHFKSSRTYLFFSFKYTRYLLGQWSALIGKVLFWKKKTLNIGHLWSFFVKLFDALFMLNLKSIFSRKMYIHYYTNFFPFVSKSSKLKIRELLNRFLKTLVTAKWQHCFFLVKPCHPLVRWRGTSGIRNTET